MEKHDTLLLACGSSANRKLLRSILEENYNLLESINLNQTVMMLEQNIDCIAAILLDISVSSRLNGDKKAKELMAKYKENTPVIIITKEETPDLLDSLVAKGASDVIPISYESGAMLKRIENVVELNLYKHHLDAMIKEQAATIHQSNEKLVDALSSIIEYRSAESGQHILRIRRFTKILLDELAVSCPEYSLTEDDISVIASASALHDIGKIAIPDAILTKPGKLTEEEREIMKTHAAIGCRILSTLNHIGDGEYLRYAHNICHYHHERWDGKGYPEGLSGDNIPICAQVVGLADVYDALISPRVYKEAFSLDTAMNMILKGDCGIFSPKLLECFKHVADSLNQVARAYEEGLSPKEEEFTLPAPSAERKVDALESIQAKYNSLFHYINAFIMEVDMEKRHYHILYNPYLEFVDLNEVTSFAQLTELILNRYVIPADRDRMEEFLSRDIQQFLHRGLRKQTFLFRLQSKDSPVGEPFEITLLRTAVSGIYSQTMTVICHKAHTNGVLPDPQDIHSQYLHNIPLDSTYQCLYDSGFTLLEMADETYSLAGYTRDDIRNLFNNRLIELVIPQDRERLSDCFREQLSRGNLVQLEHRIRCKDGRIIWVLNKSRLVTDSNGLESLYCVLVNISPVKQETDELTRKLDQYEIILSQTENSLFEWNIEEDSITFSDTFQKIFGYDPRSNVQGGMKLSAFLHPDDIPLLVERMSLLENESNYEVLEVRVSTNKGRYLWSRIRATALRNTQGKLTKIAGIIINIDSEKKAEQALQDQAERDSLTKLLNKHAGRKLAEEYIAENQEDGLHFALLIIDLDNFKQVNDTYGHMFGDVILTQVAKEIKKMFRAQDIIARIGGDEFMVLMQGISDRNLVENRCHRLLEVFDDTFRNRQYNLPLSCSVGIALAPEHGNTYVDLFQKADQALYLAKNRGKNTYVVYDKRDVTLLAAKSPLAISSTRIDSDEQPTVALNNIAQHVFQLLYTSADVSTAINEVLALIGTQMNVSRVYVFENSADNTTCSNTYEWCNTGVEPEIDTLQNISYITDIPGYEENFDERGIFYCPDVSVMPQKAFEIVDAQGIKSMLQCALYSNGVFSGYIGFDECVSKRIWTKEQIETLSYFSEILSVFLQKEQARKNISRRVNELSSILDNQNAWIYIIDPDTCELKYLNAATKKLASNAEIGMTCYSALRAQKERCANCPSLGIRQARNCCCKMSNEYLGVTVQAEATLIQWEGEDACLLTCRQIPST